MGISVGGRRNADSIFDPESRHKVAHEQGEERGWQNNINGACGEIAVAKSTGSYWGGTVGTFTRGGDIGTRWEVRTNKRHEGECWVRKGDKEGSIFWLVTGLAPDYLVWGWILGSHAKREEWLKNPYGWGEAFFPPHEAMTPLRRR